MKLDRQESFEQLAQSLRSMNDAFQQGAASAINKHVTCRNWLNGYYIVHYEQNGSDRAKYGEKLLQKLAERLKMKGYSYRDLKLYRQFYMEYDVLASAIYSYLIHNINIGQSVIAQLESFDNQKDGIRQSVIAQLGSNGIEQSAITQSDASLMVPPDKLFNRLSYTHFVQLLPIEDPLERTFYEIECIKGVWSTRELKRQIDSGYFIRSGLSRDKKALQALANQGAVQQSLHEMQPGDNPPVDILLCTAAGKEMVEYATSGVNEQLFVSEYMLKLPSKEEMRKWLVNELQELR